MSFLQYLFPYPTSLGSLFNPLLHLVTISILSLTTGVTPGRIIAYTIGYIIYLIIVFLLNFSPLKISKTNNHEG